MDRFQISLKNGTELQGYVWAPETEIRAYIVHSHGLGEHAERYSHVARHMNDLGIAFVSFDHQGHGRSQGVRGHVDEYDHLLEELDLVRKYAAGLYAGLPEFLYGHSWGGNILSNYLIRRMPDARAAVITGPWLTLNPAQTPGAFMHFLARIMATLYPTFTNENQIDPAQLSSDPKVGEAYVKDPLVHGKITAGCFIQTEQAGLYAIDHAKDIKLPTLLLHGEDDAITNVEGSRKLAEGNMERITFETFPGMRHEIHNEVDQKIVLKRISDFLLGHL